MLVLLKMNFVEVTQKQQQNNILLFLRRHRCVGAESEHFRPCFKVEPFVSSCVSGSGGFNYSRSTISKIHCWLDTWLLGIYQHSVTEEAR
jgi:hypothetical protein